MFYGPDPGLKMDAEASHRKRRTLMWVLALPALNCIAWLAWGVATQPEERGSPLWDATHDPTTLSQCYDCPKYVLLNRAGKRT